MNTKSIRYVIHGFTKENILSVSYIVPIQQKHTSDPNLQGEHTILLSCDVQHTIIFEWENTGIPVSYN